MRLMFFLHIQQWMSRKLDPINFGWELSEEKYRPIQVHEQLCPRELLEKLCCNCKTDCTLDGVAANKCGRTTHIVATEMWWDDITYYIISYGLKIMKQILFILCKRSSEETEPSSGRL